MPLVVAHRGASAAFPPGNTVEAFAAAEPLGADWVELDARITADRRIVVHHDAELADGRSIGSLARPDLPVWIPSLAEALEACDGLGVNVEIKPDGPETLRSDLIDGVLSIVRARGNPEQFLITSFDLAIIDRSLELAPDLPTGFLTIGDVRVDDSLEIARAHGHRAVNPWFGSVDAEVVDRAHRLGLNVNVWTVDDPDTIAGLVADGADGIITNVPDVCRKILSAV